MRFQPFDLLGEIATEEDELGNQVMNDVDLGRFPGRLTQWTAEEVDVLGRDFTAGNRKLLTRAPRDLCHKAMAVKLEGGDKYDITGRKDFGRWRCLYIKRYRI